MVDGLLHLVAFQCTATLVRLAGAAVAVVVPVAVATAPAAAVAAHLKVERRDMLLDGVPHGAVSFGESVMPDDFPSSAPRALAAANWEYRLPPIAWRVERDRGG